jgi:FecR-like protein/fibronectin type III domain protein
MFMKKRLSVLCCFALLLVSSCSPNTSGEKPAAKPEGSAKAVVQAEGKPKNQYSMVLKSGKVVVASGKSSKTYTKKGQTITFFDKDRISTGKKSRVLVKAKTTGDEFEVYSSSSVKVMKHGKTVGNIRLETGKARFLMRKSGTRKRNIRISTANALIGVKGTEFVVDSTQEGTSLLTLKGRVSLANANKPDVQVEVTANQVSRVQPAKLPAKPVKVSAAKIRQILNSDKPGSFKGVKFGAPVSGKAGDSSSLTVKPGSLSNQIFWKESDAKTVFDLHWTLDKNQPIAKWKVIKNISSRYLHKNLIVGKTYYYTVSFLNEFKRKTYFIAAEGSPLPLAPKSPIVTSKVGDKIVELSWNADEAAESYEIHWCQKSNQCKELKIIKTKDTLFLHEDLVNNSVYQYQVLAVNSGGNSKLSNPLEVRPNMAPPAAPQIKIQPGNKSIVLTWKKIESAESYDVFWATSPENLVNTDKQVTVKDNFLIQEGLENGVTYFFRVKAKNVGGSSDFSNTEEATPRIWLKLIRSIKNLLKTE